MSSSHQYVSTSLSRIMDNTRNIIDRLQVEIQKSYSSGVITFEQHQQMMAALNIEAQALQDQKTQVDAIAATDIDYNSPNFQTSATEAKSYGNQVVY
ncbi:hypothetical protein [Leptothoe sp. PORK10 BA2]|uniref:hypothetical protein n=1 Tax=Leptothoe sp. PORK10 BA2 TaxID=3110254 RepID=UPI002B1F8207|nr:hypothetical protein [Leptothoe sp. PORK10 BA2]MEA5464633.1 hypothetical protein [Leptothoe sp. PORK10 BA2]